jgi:hypothetical protein
MGFYYIIKLLRLLTTLFWTLSHWICLKWVHVQLWDMFGIIMLLPGFFLHFPMGFPWNGSVWGACRTHFETNQNFLHGNKWVARLD